MDVLTCLPWLASVLEKARHWDAREKFCSLTSRWYISNISENYSTVFQRNAMRFVGHVDSRRSYRPGHRTIYLTIPKTRQSSQDWNRTQKRARLKTQPRLIWTECLRPPDSSHQYGWNVTFKASLAFQMRVENVLNFFFFENWTSRGVNSGVPQFHTQFTHVSRQCWALNRKQKKIV